ncbi:uncharacterized protein LOC142320802 [Lycorma delicatula]|uniref:uncharacterized protein LOC142320802 n=1 Tax=Lycorma delicatula TaxID=130591 RepID=UPI003F510D77
MSGQIIDVDTANAVFDETITGKEFHTHYPYASTTFNNSDEIRIPVQQQDVYTLPCESYLLINGTYSDANGASDSTLKLCNNFGAFLFDEIRYEIAGQEVDRVRNVGITSTMKNALSLRNFEKDSIFMHGWSSDGVEDIQPVNGVYIDGDSAKFKVLLPLKMLLGFFEDYNKILLNVKQELILLRASTNNNAVVVPAGKTFTFGITKITWKIPYVNVSDEKRLSLLRLVDRDEPISMMFRKWNLYEYPTLPISKDVIWTVKTTTQVEKAHYVIIGFQTSRKGDATKRASNFDTISLNNIRLYLNSVYYPYEHIQGDSIILYEMFKSFYRSYYNRNSAAALITPSKYYAMPLIFIDCSKQNDTLKTGAVDIKIEIQTSTNIPDNTTAYCLMISDCIMQYPPLTGTVKNVS